MKQLICRLLLALVAIFLIGGFGGGDTLFEDLDSDRSGSISREELLKGDLVVVKDKEGKGKILHRDMVKDADTLSLTDEHKRLLFDQLDANKDGYISKEEWKRASPQGFVIWRF